MKKTRNQTVLAKCVLATIMAMGMMGYTTVWADTPTPSLLTRLFPKTLQDRFMLQRLIMLPDISGRI